MNFIKSYFKSTVVFLLAGFSVLWVYAALSTVSSWDPLTASGWNEIVWKLTSVNTNSDDLVTKSYVDSQISASSSSLSFAGYTSSAYNGNMWRIKWMNQKCNAQYTGSRVCGYDDIINLWSNYPWTENVWIHDGIQSTFADNTNSSDRYLYYIYKTWDISSRFYYTHSATCNEYTYNGNSSYQWIYLTTTWFLNQYSCSNWLKLACCNG